MFKYIFRDANMGDHAFILNSYLKSYKWDCDNLRITNTTYYTHQAKIAEKLLDKKIVIACPEDFPEQIYGYMIYELGDDNQLLIHYIFVKNIYRRLGVCRSLVSHVKPQEQAEIQCSHAHKIYDLKKEKYKLFYNPYLVVRRNYVEK